MDNLGGFEMIFLIFVLALAALLIAATWKIFEKAGKPGWAAIVPIYNLVVWTEIIRKPGYWVLLMLIPYVGLIWTIWATNLLVKSFGKDEGFTVGCIFFALCVLSHPWIRRCAVRRFAGLGAAPVANPGRRAGRYGIVPPRRAHKAYTGPVSKPAMAQEVPAFADIMPSR